MSACRELSTDSRYLPRNPLSRHFSQVFACALQRSFRRDSREQIKDTSDNARPPGLVTCSQSRAVVAMEVFTKQDVILPVRIFLEFLCTPIHRTFAVGVAKEHA